jgi:hypothetical protein
VGDDGEGEEPRMEREEDDDGDAMDRRPMLVREIQMQMWGSRVVEETEWRNRNGCTATVRGCANASSRTIY